MQRKNIPLNERLIFALMLTLPTKRRNGLKNWAIMFKFYKVGLQLFLAGWFPVIDSITKHGHKVMVDLKFFDVPETVNWRLGNLRTECNLCDRAWQRPNP